LEKERERKKSMNQTKSQIFNRIRSVEEPD
jgi:hypothetical protein